jgi:hypothetical protein
MYALSRKFEPKQPKRHKHVPSAPNGYVAIAPVTSSQSNTVSRRAPRPVAAAKTPVINMKFTLRLPTAAAAAAAATTTATATMPLTVASTQVNTGSSTSGSTSGATSGAILDTHDETAGRKRKRSESEMPSKILPSVGTDTTPTLDTTSTCPPTSISTSIDSSALPSQPKQRRIDAQNDIVPQTALDSHSSETVQPSPPATSTI